jgi:hypothetical protein
MKRRTIQASVIFLIIGGLLLALAYALQVLQANAFISLALFNAAFVMLTVFILNILWALLGGEPVSNAIEQLTESFQDVDTKLQQSFQDVDARLEQTFQNVDAKLQESFQILKQSNETGIVGLSVSGKFSHNEWADRLRKSQQQVDLMGYTLLTWIQTNFENEVLKLVHKGVRIRILILDETNPHFDSFVNSHLAGTSIETTRSELRDARKAFENIRQEVQKSKTAHSSGDFELRTAREGLITCNICRTDANMIVVSYMYWQKAVTSPLLLILQSQKEPNLFQAYQEEFDHLWELNVPPF